MTDKLCDLHTHSTASDGTLSPSELAYAAERAGLCACAITDHDTVSGVEEFMSTCKDAGIEGIAGVELSAEFTGEMHIVGLFVDYRDEKFKRDLYRLANARAVRNEKMIAKCCENGLPVTKEELLRQKDVSDLNSIGRPHFAHAFLERGYVESKDEAFEKYLAKGKSCYCERELYKPEKCIEMIHSAGGLAVLAHPVYISRVRSGLEGIIEELKDYGLDAMECVYSEHDKEFTALCEELCAQYGLLKSGGSDFHGANKPSIAIGTGHGDISVPYEFVEEMKKRRDRN